MYASIRSNIFDSFSILNNILFTSKIYILNKNITLQIKIKCIFKILYFFVKNYINFYFSLYL